MPIFFNEMKRGKLALIIWSAGMAAMMAITVLIFPLIEPMMSSLGEAYMDFGFDMSSIEMDFMSYIASEFAELMTLCGAIYAGIIASSALSGEERGRTAEFLLSHPVSRTRVAAEKMFYVFNCLFIFSLSSLVLTYASVLVIGEEIEFVKMLLLFASCFAIQLEVAGICFLFSATVRANGIGFAIGFSLLMYVLQLVSTMGEKLKFLNYFTPYSMCSTAEIIENGRLDWKYCIVWPVIAIASVIFAVLYYKKKDIYC